MRVLVTWGSKRGGTEGIGEMLAADLRREGFEVITSPAGELDAIDADAVIVGGALYANRWHSDARRFIERHLAELREVPVWLFSSGPLDDSARQAEIPPPRQVATLMDRVGALGHRTFGGALAADAEGFPARAMAKEHSGDWRDPGHIRQWAQRLAEALPDARPGQAIEPPGRSIPRLLFYAAFGWALAAAAMLVLPAVLHLVLVPVIFALVARSYFAARGARAPLPAAIVFALVMAALDAGIIAGLSLRDAALLGSVVDMWLPITLALATTWLTGAIMSMKPPPEHRPMERPLEHRP